MVSLFKASGRSVPDFTMDNLSESVPLDILGEERRLGELQGAAQQALDLHSTGQEA